MQLTIVIPMYNSSSYIRDLLQDLNNQTFSDFKIIIIDDCSNDDSVKVVEKMLIPNLSVVKLECNVGRSEARNIGLTHVETEFVVFMDSDDRVSPYFIEDFKRLSDYSTDSEMLVLGWTNNFSDLKVKPSGLHPKVFGQSELLMNVLTNKGVFYSLWNKAFSVDKIREKNISFPKYVFSEDLTFIFNFVMENSINSAVVDTRQIDYYWRPSVSKQQTKGILSSHDTNSFDENYSAIMTLRKRVLSSGRLDAEALLTELDYLLLQHYVHSPSRYSKSEFLPILVSALKSKAPSVQKVRLIFNFAFGLKLESVLYRLYMKFRNRQSVSL